MLLMLCASIRGTAQDVDGVTGATKQHADTTVASKALNALSHLHLGGYGEAVMTRNFYSQSFNPSLMPYLSFSLLFSDLHF